MLLRACLTTRRAMRSRPSNRGEPPPSGYPVGLLGGHVEIVCAERLTQHLTLFLSTRVAPGLLVSVGAHPGPSVQSHSPCGNARPGINIKTLPSWPRRPNREAGSFPERCAAVPEKTQHRHNEITSFVDRGLRNFFFRSSPPLAFWPC